MARKLKEISSQRDSIKREKSVITRRRKTTSAAKLEREGTMSPK